MNDEKQKNWMKTKVEQQQNESNNNNKYYMI